MDEERIASFDETDWNVTDEEGDEDSSSSEFEDIEDGNTSVADVVKKIKDVAKSKIKKLNAVPCIFPLEVCEKWLEFYSEDSSDIYGQENGKNLMIVIQNKYFEKSLQRHGSTKDAENLKKTFSKLGFIVKVFKDLTAERIDKKLRKARQKFNHKEASCFACVILSHGENIITNVYEQKDCIVGVDEQVITVEYIMKIFNNDNCPDLKGKPRLFFIQACRGKDSEKGMDIKLLQTNPNIGNKKTVINAQEETYIDAVPEPGNISVPIVENTITCPSPCYTDSLVMFASPPGFTAFSRKGGSIFISCLCDEFQNYSQEKTFHQKLTMLAKQMAFEFTSFKLQESIYDNCKVVPCIHSCLTKDIKFKSWS